MSRCVLDDEDRNIEVVIGWDPSVPSRPGTFFARVFDHNKARASKSKSESDYDAAGLVFWTGGFDREYDDPDVLITLIQPYAAPHDPRVLRRELLRDQREDLPSRSYSISGSDVED